jgi:CHASE3 domain sensor protein
MKNHSNRSFYNLAFGIALLILILIGIMSFRASRQAEEYDNLVSHTYTVIEKMDSLLLNLGDAESMQRGLIITSDRNYAIAYDSIVKNFPVRISQLRQLTLDNPSQTIRLDSIEQMVDEKVEWMDTSIQVLNKYGREAAISKLKTGTGWTIMHSIRQLVYEAQVEEKDLLKERKEFKKEYTSNLYVIFLSGGILSLVILILIFISAH